MSHLDNSTIGPEGVRALAIKLTNVTFLELSIVLELSKIMLILGLKE
jgi:hypothetical protein